MKIDSSAADSGLAHPASPTPIPPGEERVLVSILNWFDMPATLRCVENVLASDWPALDVIVIDNGSRPEEFAALKERFAQIRTIRPDHNLGFAGGHNLSLSIAKEQRYPFSLLVNNDATLAPDAITQMIKRFHAEEGVGLLSPVIRNDYDQNGIEFCGAWADYENLCIGRSRDIETIRSRESSSPASMWLHGTVLLIPLKTLETVGLLDERYFAYFEDNDFSARVANAGFYNRVAFEANAYHSAPQRVAEKGEHYFYLMARNKLLFWREHGHNGRSLRRRLKLIGEVLRFVAESRDRYSKTRCRAALLGFLDGIRNHSGPWVPGRQPPAWLARLILWHPWFLARLLGGG